MRQRRRRLLMTMGSLARLPRFPRRLRRSKRFPLRSWLAVVLVCTVGSSAVGGRGCCALMTRGRRSGETGRLACGCFPVAAAAAAPATTAASAPAPPLAALGAIARALALLSLLRACLDAGARLLRCRRRRRAHARLCGPLADIPIPWPSIVIPVVLAPAAIVSIIAASFGAPAVPVTAALAALGAARLAGMLPAPVATPLATVM